MVNPRFWSKNGHFSNLFFLGKIGKENVFYDILEQKKANVGYKNKNFKQSKNSHFSTGVNQWVLTENGHGFTLFFLGNIGTENIFYHILEPKKNAFLGYKKEKFKKSKNWHFFKGVNRWFWSINNHFSKLFF